MAACEQYTVNLANFELSSFTSDMKDRVLNITPGCTPAEAYICTEYSVQQYSVH